MNFSSFRPLKTLLTAQKARECCSSDKCALPAPIMAVRNEEIRQSVVSVGFPRVLVYPVHTRYGQPLHAVGKRLVLALR